MALDSYANLQTALADWLESDNLTSFIPDFITLAEARHRREIRTRDMLTRLPLLAGSSATISGATAANPVVITATAHGFADGEDVYIQDVKGMVEINDRRFIVANKTANTFELQGEDGTGHTAYSSGGTATLTKVDDRFSILPSNFLQAKTLRLLTDPVTVMQELNLHEMNRQRKETTDKPTRYTVHNEIEFNVTPDQEYDGEMVYYAAFQPLSDANTSNALLEKSPDVYLYASLLESAPFLLQDERTQLWARLYQDARDRLNGSERSSQTIGPLVSKVWGASP